MLYHLVLLASYLQEKETKPLKELNAHNLISVAVVGNIVDVLIQVASSSS